MTYIMLIIGKQGYIYLLCDNSKLLRRGDYQFLQNTNSNLIVVSLCQNMLFINELLDDSYTFVNNIFQN